MDLNKKMKEIEKKDGGQQVENQQNNFYLGSTADIQKMLQQGDVIDVESDNDIPRES